MHIVDIYALYEKLDFFLFADDTNLSYADKSLRSLEVTTNQELRNASNWCVDLLTSKYNFDIVKQYQKRADYQVNINMFDCSANSLVSLERKEYMKYFGVLID